LYILEQRNEQQKHFPTEHRGATSHCLRIFPTSDVITHYFAVFAHLIIDTDKIQYHP